MHYCLVERRVHYEHLRNCDQTILNFPILLYLVMLRVQSSLRCICSYNYQGYCFYSIIPYITASSLNGHYYALIFIYVLIRLSYIWIWFFTNKLILLSHALFLPSAWWKISAFVIFIECSCTKLRVTFR